jgi:carbon starvation protein
MSQLARAVGEETLFNRTGGAPAFAVGMAHIFAHSLGGQALMAIWYHFAIMFEALFILTVLDAGTRVGRFMLQEGLGHLWKPLGPRGGYPSILASSAVMVALWGYFLWMGVKDPLGGINSIWPLFGIANQLLGTVALCVATTILIKSGRVKYAWVTLLPLMALISITFTAALEKMFSARPRIGFLAHAQQVSAQIAAGTSVPRAAQQLLNDRIDTAVTGALLVLVTLVLVESVREWLRVLTGSKAPEVTEAPFVPSRFVVEES